MLKIFEKYMKKGLLIFTNEYNIIKREQWGFQSKVHYSGYISFYTSGSQKCECKNNLDYDIHRRESRV